MNQSLEVTNIKTEPIEPTSTNRLEIATLMKMKSVKQESACLALSEIYIKTEPYEDESGFPVTESTCYKMCPNDNIKAEINEPVIRNVCHNLENEIMQDPLGVGKEMKMEWNMEAQSTSSVSEQTKENTEQTQKENPLDEQVRKNKLYSCTMCNSTFRHKVLLDLHLRTHLGEKPFQCDFCKKSYPQKRILDIHSLVHNNGKPYVCSVCKKSFAHKHLLLRHERIHTCEKPYACDICHKKFICKSYLISHRRVHTGEKPYSCAICNESFSQRSGLNYHKRSHEH